VAAAVSVGYVFWTGRAAYLISSLLASTPAWRLVDPLPVLEFTEAERIDKRSRRSELDPEGSLAQLFR
jgi:hypothetical protein